MPAKAAARDVHPSAAAEQPAVIFARDAARAMTVDPKQGFPIRRCRARPAAKRSVSLIGNTIAGRASLKDSAELFESQIARGHYCKPERNKHERCLCTWSITCWLQARKQLFQ